MAAKLSKPFSAFETGQHWRMKESHVLIKQVGKTLVHYSHSKLRHKVSRILLVKHAALEEFLKMKKAVLVG